jgi:hypothetical protein
MAALLSVDKLETRESCALQSQPFAAKPLIWKGNGRVLRPVASRAGSQLDKSLIIQAFTGLAGRLARRLQLYP